MCNSQERNCVPRVRTQNSWLQVAVCSVILNKSSYCFSICLSFSSCKMGILLLTYLTVGGRGLWGPEVLKGLWQSVRAKAWHKVYGLLFKNAQAHWPLKKDRECSFDISRNKGGAPRLEATLRERLAFENISLVEKLDFLPLILAFTGSIIWF